MASITLYPPIINSSEPAFIATTGAKCPIHFSLSNYSTNKTIKSIHISIVKQNNGQNIVNRENNSNGGRWRSSGIVIINKEIIADNNSDFFVDILEEDILNGWQIGWLYKIQIRVSEVKYVGNGSNISQWLNENSNLFSEWSTACIIKATGPAKINFYNDYFKNSVASYYDIFNSRLELSGTYTNNDKSEYLKSYSFKLIDNDEVIEESGLIYSDDYVDTSKIYYLFKKELGIDKYYKVIFNFNTINDLKGEYSSYFKYSTSQDEFMDDTSIVTLDSLDTITDKNYIYKFKNETSIIQEQEDGVVGLKLYSPSNLREGRTYIISRADSTTNFTIWTDIKKIEISNNDYVNDIPVFFDTLIENEVWYKYAIQIYDNGNRTQMKKMITPIIRYFEYSYLIGENGKRLKLKYNNKLSNYSYNISEGKMDPIGSKYAIITRNGKLSYRSFNLEGMITFNMDETDNFISDKELYQYDEVIQLYKEEHRNKNIVLYDYKKEFDFREKVIKFLQDGKPKLFKSATEGNIIVRLMKVTLKPNDVLNRFIYSFSCEAIEIDDFTFENCLKYNYYNQTLKLAGENSNSNIRIGQLETEFSNGDNILEKIWEKYMNINNMNDYSIARVFGLSIEYIGHYYPIVLTDNDGSSEIIYGNKVNYNNNQLIIRADSNRIYVFDEDIDFTQSDTLIVADDTSVNKSLISINFLYEIQENSTISALASKSYQSYIGQIYGNYKPGSDIYNEVYFKTYYKDSTILKELDTISWSSIEAPQGAVFEIIQDSINLNSNNQYIINEMGILNLENFGKIVGLKYLGMITEEGSIDNNKNADILIDYVYILLEGRY